MKNGCILSAIWTASLLSTSSSFQVLAPLYYRTSSSASTTSTTSTTIAAAPDVGDWTGDVASNPGGRMQGSKIIQEEGMSIVDWIVQIDGVQADLGKFSGVIHKKIIADAKTQRFQGFRPGTIPPHLQRTYRAYAMDECAREATLEALVQNDIRPFENSRSTMVFSDFSIPPPRQNKNKGGKNKKKKKKKKKKKDVNADAEPESEPEPEPDEDEQPEEVPQWRSFDTMDKAIDAGWEPGQSFSFVATTQGQKLNDQDLTGVKPISQLPY